MKSAQEYSYLDLHTAGEPFRLITDPIPDIPGETMEQKRQYAAAYLNQLRRLVLLEPRGHNDMYGGFLMKPVRTDSNMGVLFMMAEGMTTMCGHGILCLARAAVELGLLQPHEGENTLIIDAPSATVCASIFVKEQEIQRISFTNDISFSCGLGLPIQVPGYGTVRVDVGYGAAFMVFVHASDLGLSLGRENFSQMLAAAALCRRAVMEQLDVCHPADAGKSLQHNGCCLILTDEPVPTGMKLETQCFTVFGESQFDRSPTGTGTSALAAILYEKGLLTSQMQLINRGISGIPFTATIQPVSGGVIPTISAMAYVTGRGKLILEEGDPLTAGFSATVD